MLIPLRSMCNMGGYCTKVVNDCNILQLTLGEWCVCDNVFLCLITNNVFGTQVCSPSNRNIFNKFCIFLSLASAVSCPKAALLSLSRSTAGVIDCRPWCWNCSGRLRSLMDPQLKPAARMCSCSPWAEHAPSVTKKPVQYSSHGAAVWRQACKNEEWNRTDMSKLESQWHTERFLKCMKFAFVHQGLQPSKRRHLNKCPAKLQGEGQRFLHSRSIFLDIGWFSSEWAFDSSTMADNWCIVCREIMTFWCQEFRGLTSAGHGAVAAGELTWADMSWACRGANLI